MKCTIHTPWGWPLEGWNMSVWYSVKKAVAIICAFSLYLKYSKRCYWSMALSVATVSFKTRVRETVTAISISCRPYLQGITTRNWCWQFQLSFRNVTILDNPDPTSLIGISCKHNKYSHSTAYPLRFHKRSIITKMSTEYLKVGWCSALLPRLPMASKMNKNPQSQFPHTSSLCSSKTREAT